MLTDSSSALERSHFYGLEKLQEQVAMFFCLLASILVAVLALSDFLLGLDGLIVWVKLSLMIPFLGGYLLIRRVGYHPLVLNIVLIISHVGIFFNYINNDGFRGPTIYTYAVLVVGIAVLLRGKNRMIWFGISLLTFCLMFYGEIAGFLRVEQNYATPMALYTDHLVTIIWSSLFIFIGLYVFVSRFKKQTEEIEKLREEQEEGFKKIEEIDEEKNRLLALLSHDLKNPIGTLSTTLSLVDEGFYDEKEIQQILHNLREQSYHLEKVLNNTLSYVMAEMGTEPKQIEAVALASFTEEIKDIMQVQANQKRQEIDFKLKGQDLSVPLEINEVSIILKNLIDNAIKFSEVDSTVYFTLEISKETIKWLVINEGLEIPTAEREDIFDFKAKTSYGTKKEKGTGLGLPLAKKLADSIDMDLGFESSSFKTVFYLEKVI